MKFWEREYDCYVILGLTGLPWAHSEWMSITNVLSPIAEACRGKGLLRVNQLDSSTRKWLKFGKIEWKAEHHAKWTHGSPLTAGKDSTWEFYTVEGSFPSLPQCGRDNCPPDLHFVILNEVFGDRNNPPAFNPRFFFALASDLRSETRNQMMQVVRTLARQYRSILTATIHRPWGEPFGSGFSNALQDISFTGLFKVGNYHNRPVTLETFEKKWESIS